MTRPQGLIYKVFIAPLKSNVSIYTDPVQQATTLNQQFESVSSRHKYDLLSPFQHGFRSKYSCEPNL